VQLRLRHEGADHRTSLPLDGHGHEHAQTVHGGVAATFQNTAGGTSGHLELKLHDDKGDLELWIGQDSHLEEPVDLPLDALLVVAFIDVDNREVTLRVRNNEQNEDEDGKPNIRDGKTNYFIYPGDSGEDSTWLTGADFHSVVTVAWQSEDQKYRSEEFVLVPHTHTDGHAHD
jgi:hypothetical protein